MKPDRPDGGLVKPVASPHRSESAVKCAIGRRPALGEGQCGPGGVSVRRLAPESITDSMPEQGSHKTCPDGRRLQDWQQYYRDGDLTWTSN